MLLTKANCFPVLFFINCTNFLPQKENTCLRTLNLDVFSFLFFFSLKKLFCTLEWGENNSSETFLFVQILFEPLVSSVKSCQKKLPDPIARTGHKPQQAMNRPVHSISIKSPCQERRLWGQAVFGGAVCSWSYSLFMELFEITAAGVDI